MELGQNGLVIDVRIVMLSTKKNMTLNAELKRVTFRWELFVSVLYAKLNTKWKMGIQIRSVTTVEKLARISLPLICNLGSYYDGVDFGGLCGGL
jgi:hypothetical protein